MIESNQQPKSIEPARVHLTDRQIKYLAARSSGMNRTDAVRAAGYSDNVKPSQIEGKKGMRRAILDALEVNGVTDEFLGRKLKEGLDAEKVTLVTFKGQIMNEHKAPDYENRHKYVKTTLELRGDLAPENQTNVNVGLIEVPRMSKDAEAWNAEVVDEKP